MLSSFINTNTNIAVEAISSMAIMLGEDPTVACENDTNATGVMSRFKEAVKKAVTKVREFIKKVMAWIKGKLLTLLKRDSIVVDQELWLNVTSALNELDAVKLGFIDSFNLGVFLGRHKSITFTDETENMSKKIEVAAAEIKNKFKTVTEGKYFRGAMERTTNGKKITVSTSALEKSKTRITTDLDKLDKISNIIEDAINNTNEDMVNYTKALTAYSIINNVRINALNHMIALINILVVAGERQNAKN